MKYNLNGKIGLSLMLPATMVGFLSAQDRSVWPIKEPDNFPIL